MSHSFSFELPQALQMLLLWAGEATKEEFVQGIMPPSPSPNATDQMTFSRRESGLFIFQYILIRVTSPTHVFTTQMALSYRRNSNLHLNPTSNQDRCFAAALYPL